MKNLRNSILAFLLILPLILTACTSSSYQILRTHTKDGVVRGTELSVTPDRINLECEDVSSENEIHGLMLHVLNNENHVISFVHMGTFEKKVCFEVLRKINKVIRRGNNIYLFGMGNSESDPSIAGRKIFFPNKGHFLSNGISFQFLIIKNDRGDCYGAYVGDTECPKVGLDYFPKNN